jgi:uncharacterized protein
MSRNIDTAKAAYAHFANGDIASILALLAPDIAWEYGWGGPVLKWYEPRHGRDAVAKFFATLADFEFVRFAPVEFLEGGNMVAVPIEIELIVKATGKSIRDLEMHLWTYGADGRVSRFRHLVDTLQLAEAARVWCGETAPAAVTEPLRRS